MPRGHTVPNLVRKIHRLQHVLRQRNILIRAQGAYIQELKGEPTVSGTHRRSPTIAEAALNIVNAQKAASEALLVTLKERDTTIGELQARLKDVEVELTQARTELLRTVERKRETRAATDLHGGGF